MKKIIVLLIIFFLFSTIFAKKNQITKIGKDIPITGNIEQLKYFFDALEKTKNEKIRIAHYGDSIIWGDIITDNLRVYFQKKYGGHGIGFISLCNDDLSARQTIIHKFSDDWSWASVFTKNREHYPIGIAGIVAKAGAKSSVYFESRKVSPAVDSFSETKLFYSNVSSNAKVKFSIDNKDFKTLRLLATADKLAVTELYNGKEAKKINLEFINAKGGFFYGITLDGGNGIYVDNFSFRGNSGVSLRDINDKLLPGFASNLNYKLFILQFGVNVAASGNVKYKWYERQMLHVIKKIRKYFPKSSILIISPGDLGQKKGKKIITHPEIKKFVKAQERIATKAQVAFWNMFQAMGGNNSITRWVNASPPLAYKDYCHLTWEGGEVISTKLLTALFKVKSKIK